MPVPWPVRTAPACGCFRGAGRGLCAGGLVSGSTRTQASSLAAPGGGLGAGLPSSLLPSLRLAFTGLGLSQSFVTRSRGCRVKTGESVRTDAGTTTERRGLARLTRWLQIGAPDFEFPSLESRARWGAVCSGLTCISLSRNVVTCPPLWIGEGFILLFSACGTLSVSGGLGHGPPSIYLV